MQPKICQQSLCFSFSPPTSSSTSISVPRDEIQRWLLHWVCCVICFPLYLCPSPSKKAAYKSCCGWYLVTSLAVSNSLRPLGLQSARLLWTWDFPGKNIGVWVVISFSRVDLLNPSTDLPNPSIEPATLALAGRFFATAPPRKPPQITLAGLDFKVVSLLRLLLSPPPHPREGFSSEKILKCHKP